VADPPDPLAPVAAPGAASLLPPPIWVAEQLPKKPTVSVAATTSFNTNVCGFSRDMP
jgi:hypothetical protein